PGLLAGESSSVRAWRRQGQSPRLTNLPSTAEQRIDARASEQGCLRVIRSMKLSSRRRHLPNRLFSSTPSSMIRVESSVYSAETGYPRTGVHARLTVATILLTLARSETSL